MLFEEQYREGWKILNKLQWFTAFNFSALHLHFKDAKNHIFEVLGNLQ